MPPVSGLSDLEELPAAMLEPESWTEMSDLGFRHVSCPFREKFFKSDPFGVCVFGTACSLHP